MYVCNGLQIHVYMYVCRRRAAIRASVPLRTGTTSYTSTCASSWTPPDGAMWAQRPSTRPWLSCSRHSLCYIHTYIDEQFLNACVDDVRSGGPASICWVIRVVMSCMYACMYVCMNDCMCGYMNVCTYDYMYDFMYVCTYVCMYGYMDICLHVYKYFKYLICIISVF